MAEVPKPCYHPGSDEAAGDYPCQPGAKDSVCCTQGSACLSNKTCQPFGGGIQRGTCTDPDWESDDCPAYGDCRDEHKAEGNMRGLTACDNFEPLWPDTFFCCDNTLDCCDTGIGIFALVPSRPQIWATWDVNNNQFVVVPTTSELEVAAPTPPLAVTSPSSTDSTGTTGTTGTTIATSSSALPPNPSLPGTSSSAQTQSSGLSTAAQAGIGVGISICAILLGVIAYFLWKLNRKKKQAGLPGDQGHSEDQMRPTSMNAGQLSQPEMFGYPAELAAEQKWPVELDGVAKHQPAELLGATTHLVEK